MQKEKDVVSRLIAILENDSSLGEPFTSYRAGEVRMLWWMLSGRDVIPEPQIIEELCAKYDGTVNTVSPGFVKITLRNPPRD
jgi:hypothetical protein